VNGVKIDRSFVRDLPADLDMSEIVRGILALARTLRLEVVAEGVETRGQRQLLCDMGCRQMQGYLFGRPGAAEECHRYLEEPALGIVGM
jgi:EAL domain-containing protein (putative c-di-GMP-specific phosphodiesterase class I)